MNTTRETVEPAMRAAADDIVGEELSDIVPVETRNLMGFYASLRKLLSEVCRIGQEDCRVSTCSKNIACRTTPWNETDGVHSAVSTTSPFPTSPNPRTLASSRSFHT